MPGIVGLITRMPRSAAEPQLQRMVRSMLHEPFYTSGTWVDEALGVYVGWIELGHSCSSPGLIEVGDRILLFSGEDFSAAETGQRMQRQNCAVETSATQALVRMAEHPDFPARLNGQFQGILVDPTTGKITLFNDRYGLQRLYYHQGKDAFYFAAEAKAILQVVPELRSLDWQSMAEYVACGSVLEDRTLFRNLHVLPNASAWILQGGELKRKHSYFSPQEWEERPPLQAEEYYQHIRDIFSGNLPRFFKSPERIALSLTGGLDTRMMLAWLNPAPGSLPCYTFGGHYRESRDVRVARKVARQCGQSHHVIEVGTDFLSRFPRYSERTVYLTDGCVGVNHSPDLYLNELARQIAPIRMTGNYGDQVLRHLTVVRPVDPSPGLFAPEFLNHITAASHTWERISRGHALTVAAFRQMSCHYYGLRALESTQLTMRSPYLDNELVQTLYRAPKSTLVNNDMRVRLIRDGNPELELIRTDLGFAGRGGPLCRALSSRYHRFTMRAEYAYDYGMSQWLARIDHRLSRMHLERAFLGRHKFSHFRIWYRGALANYVRDMLLDPRTLSRPYLNPGALREIVSGHLHGNRNYTTAIHKILTLEYLHRLFLDSK